VKLILALLALLFSTSAFAETEVLNGECQHADRFTSQLARLINFSSSGSISCGQIRIDWSDHIEFIKDDDKLDTPLLTLRGTSGDGPYSFNVTGIDQYLSGPEPATGQCQMFRPEISSGKRTFGCFVEQMDQDGEKQAWLIDFIVDDEVLSIGQQKTYPGACSESKIGDILLTELVAGAVKERVSIAHLPAIQCNTATIIAGKSVTFANDTQPDDRLIFSGSAELNDPNRIVIENVKIGREAPKQVIAGTCAGLRDLDGTLHTLCSAAFREAGAVKGISVEFPKPIDVGSQ
jgi:hypothetical protein